MDDVTIKFFSFLSNNLIDSLLPWVCAGMDRRRRQNVVKISVTHSAEPCEPFKFLPHDDVICVLLPNRRTPTRNLFVNLTMFTAGTSLLSEHLKGNAWELDDFLLQTRQNPRQILKVKNTVQ